MNLCREPETRTWRLKWLGHEERMSEGKNVRKVFKNTPERKRSVGKPRKRRLDNVKMIWRKRLEENSERQRRLEIDPDGGQDCTRTVEPVEKEGCLWGTSEVEEIIILNITTEHDQCLAASKASIIHTTTWLYSPSWALASCAIRLHKFLSWAFPLHPSIPIAHKSSSASSNHLILGLPLLLWE
jgi:hypothetical protein